MKNFYLLFFAVITAIVVFVGSVVNAQQLISTSGGFLQNSQQSISYSIGEPVIDCYSVGSIMLTHGIQQPNRSVITFSTPVLEESNIRVYPNPTYTGRCILDVARLSFSNVFYKLLDSSGMLVQTRKISNTTTALSLEALAPSVYFLQIIDPQNRIIKTVKIIKL